jgi:hypothetical protein
MIVNFTCCCQVTNLILVIASGKRQELLESEPTSPYFKAKAGTVYLKPGLLASAKAEPSLAHLSISPS